MSTEPAPKSPEQANPEAPVELQDFLKLVVESEEGFSIGEPWKYSEDALAVVVPILRPDAPDREYVTMYEVLKDLNIKDTGSISVVELQSKVDKPIFVRAGTIFTGSTQNRASQNSGVYQGDKANIDVRCVHQTHGISRGAKMEFGDIAPPSVTSKLMSRASQQQVWQSVHNYTRQEPVVESGEPDYTFVGYCTDGTEEDEDEDEDMVFGATFDGGVSDGPEVHRLMSDDEEQLRDNIVTGQIRDIQDHAPDLGKYLKDIEKVKRQVMERSNLMGGPGGPRIGASKKGGQSGQSSRGVRGGPSTHSHHHRSRVGNGRGHDDLLGHLKKRDEGRALLDEMMQKVPLFDEQSGAILFNPTGVVAVECFDHPDSWAAIKKEVIEKHGDKIMKEQADHLFELRPDRITPMFKKFVDRLSDYKEQTIRKDSFAETRIIKGKGIVGEYTIVLGRVVHCLFVKD